MDGKDSNVNTDNQNENQGTNEQQNNGGNENNKNEKTFTQEQVSAMMAKEKKEGRQSMLNSLGFKTEEEAKDAFKLLKALTDSQKSEEEKKNEESKKLNNENAELAKKASLAEAKLSCFMNGVNKDSVDDVLAIATQKVTEEKDLDTVISEMKKQDRYSSFFGTQKDEQDDEGTGNKPGNSSNKNTNKGEYGAKLAQSLNKDGKTSKQSFFN